MGRTGKVRMALGAAAVALLLLLFAEYFLSFGKKQEETVDLKIYVMNDIKNEAHVLEEFEARTLKELGIRVEMIAQPAETYKQELPELLDIQKNADIVFDAPWISMGLNISRDKYVDLTEYLKSGEYRGLSAAFSSRYLEDNKMNGGIYGLPVTKVFYDVPGIIYRKDLLGSYGLPFESIENSDQLLQFYDAVKEKDPDMIPLSVGKRGFFKVLFRDEFAMMNEGVYEIPGFGWPNVPALVYLSKDGTKAEDIVFLGDDDGRCPDGRPEMFREAYLKQAEWNRYLSENSLMTTDTAAEFLAGKSASYENTLGEGTKYLEEQLKETIPEAKVGFYASNATLWGGLSGLQIKKSLTAWNYACIPKSSRHKKEALSFLDWLFASQENNDLFTYGVEGIDWMAGQKGGEYRLCAENEYRYEFPAYTHSYNPKYLRYEERLNENEKELILAMADENNFVGSPLSGFVADYSEMQAEYQALIRLYAEYHVQFMHGKYGEDTEAKIAEFHARAKEIGLERIRTSICSQIQSFLDEK